MAVTNTSLPSPKMFNRFLNYLKNRPLLAFVTLLFLFIIESILLHVPSWTTGTLVFPNLISDLVFPALWLPVNIAFWIWLDMVALDTLSEYAKVLDKSKKDAETLFVNFVSIDPKIAIAISTIAFGAGFLEFRNNFYNYGNINLILLLLSALLPALGTVLEALSTFRLLKQLFNIRDLYKAVKEINLFNLFPIYSLSRYGYTLAFGFILATVIIDLGVRVFTGNGLGYETILYNLFVSLIIFFLPLLGLNKRLRKAKNHELQQLGNIQKVQFDQLSLAIEAGDNAQILAHKSSLAAIKDQVDLVKSTGTWPWQPGSIRNLLLPILLPIFIGLLQRYLYGFLGI